MSELVCCPVCQSTRLHMLVNSELPGFALGCLDCQALGPRQASIAQAEAAWQHSVEENSVNQATPVPFQPCLLCHTTDALLVEHISAELWSAGLTSVVQGQLGDDTTDPGYQVRCTTCNLRGPWRPTEADARAAWNTRVTAHQTTATEATKE